VLCAQDYMENNKSELRKFFSPQSVAVIGAKDELGSVGRTLMVNLTSDGFAGTVFPVSPKHTTVLGHRCYPSVIEIEEPIDLAIIVVPARVVPEVLRGCGQAKITTAIIISAGFKESGPEGKKLEKEVVKIAKEGGIRVIGPNCLGVMNPHVGFNGTFAGRLALPGSLALLSQSGAMCTAVLDWSLFEEVGFSAFVSIGSMADVGWADLIDYFGSDPATKAILMYMETVEEPERFLVAAKAVAQKKPIIVIKPGRTKEAAKAAASHTGAIVGSDAVFDAVCEKAGVLRVETMNELFDMAEILERQPYPTGPNIAIVTNAGGPGVLATDAAVRCGASMAKLSKETIDSLNRCLPAAWSHGNPVDLIGDADPERYERAVEAVMKDKGVDGLLVILTPQEMTDPLGCAKSLERFSYSTSKPLFTSWMGGVSVNEAKRALIKIGLPCFGYPEEAVWSFSTLWNHSQALGLLTDGSTPSSSEEVVAERKQKATLIIEQAYKEKRDLLSEFESKEILTAYDLPIVKTIRATTSDEAVIAAEEIGYPVVMKIDSHRVIHKAKAGGVALNLTDRTAVQSAFIGMEEVFDRAEFLGVTVQKMISLKGVELIVGSSTDPQFGPAILFGAGGRYVEALGDQTLALPPLTQRSARRMIEKTKGSKAVEFDYGGEYLEKIEVLLIRFSEMILELPAISECDINPVLATASGLLCLDARMVLSI